uniref:Acyl carrier protein n=1 Tax=uncultured bacterium CSLC2 TaxID=1091571 RepID=Q8KNZ8_9BACT|nr:acyl carrier protein [uncultured bacterium CSLC2]
MTYHDMDSRDTIIEIIADTLQVPREQVREESKLIDLAKDSIALFELLIRLEKQFSHKVKYEDIAHIETVGDISAFIGALPSATVLPLSQESVA